MKVSITVCDHCGQQIANPNPQTNSFKASVGQCVIEKDVCDDCRGIMMAYMKGFFNGMDSKEECVDEPDTTVVDEPTMADEPDTTVVNGSAAANESDETIVDEPDTTDEPVTIDDEKMQNTTVPSKTKKGPLAGDEKQKIDADYKAGVPIETIAESVGRSVKICEKYIKMRFSNIPEDNDPLVSEDTAETDDKVDADDETSTKILDEGKILALYKAGWTIKNIAGDCHCEEEDVKRVLRKRTNKE